MKVNGYCPMGCGRTIYTNVMGEVHCADPGCPRFDAVDQILNEQETEHVVRLSYDGWSMKHPLRERLDDELLHCAAGAVAAGLGGRRPFGTYRLYEAGGDWHWDRLADG